MKARLYYSWNQKRPIRAFLKFFNSFEENNGISLGTNRPPSGASPSKNTSLNLNIFFYHYLMNRSYEKY